MLHSKIKIFYVKIEIRKYEFVFNKFPDDSWTYGGGLKYKNEKITRDLYSNKLKVCFEYDGVWHFKDIHGQLEKKQYKDKLLEEWCIENNYRLIRLKDEVYLKNKSKVLDLLIDEIYNGTNKIVKIYDYIS